MPCKPSGRKIICYSAILSPLSKTEASLSADPGWPSTKRSHFICTLAGQSPIFHGKEWGAEEACYGECRVERQRPSLLSCVVLFPSWYTGRLS